MRFLENMIFKVTAHRNLWIKRDYNFPFFPEKNLLHLWPCLYVYIHPTLVTRWLFKFEPKERKRKSEREKKIFWQNISATASMATALLQLQSMSTFASEICICSSENDIENYIGKAFNPIIRGGMPAASFCGACWTFFLSNHCWLFKSNVRCHVVWEVFLQ